MLDVKDPRNETLFFLNITAATFSHALRPFVQCENNTDTA